MGSFPNFDGGCPTTFGGAAEEMFMGGGRLGLAPMSRGMILAVPLSESVGSGIGRTPSSMSSSFHGQRQLFNVSKIRTWNIRRFRAISQMCCHGIRFILFVSDPSCSTRGCCVHALHGSWSCQVTQQELPVQKPKYCALRQGGKGGQGEGRDGLPTSLHL